MLGFLFACLATNISCMEDPIHADETQLVQFDNFSNELLVHLFSFIPEATSMKEIFNKLAQLSLVNSEFKQIAEDLNLLNELAKRYVEFHLLSSKL